jgi:hypothetical protein
MSQISTNEKLLISATALIAVIGQLNWHYFNYSLLFISPKILAGVGYLILIFTGIILLAKSSSRREN